MHFCDLLSTKCIIIGAQLFKVDVDSVFTFFSSYFYDKLSLTLQIAIHSEDSDVFAWGGYFDTSMGNFLIRMQFCDLCLRLDLNGL